MQAVTPHQQFISAGFSQLPFETVTKIVTCLLKSESLSFRQHYFRLEAFAITIYENSDNRVDKVCTFLRSSILLIKWHEYIMATNSITKDDLILFTRYLDSPRLKLTTVAPDASDSVKKSRDQCDNQAKQKMVSAQFQQLLRDSDNKQETAADCVVEAVEKGILSILFAYNELKLKPKFANMPEFANMSNSGYLREGFDLSILHLAIKSKKLETLLFILLVGINPLRVNPGTMNSVLKLAAQTSSTSTMVLLAYSHMAKIQLDQACLNTSLFAVLEHKQRDSVPSLLCAGADANAEDSNGNSHLHYAVQSNQYETVLILLDKGADANAEDINGNSPLHYAVQSNQFETVWILLDKGADPNAEDSNGNSPLHYAVRSNQFKTVLILLDKGADPDNTDRDGNTPLHIAVKNNTLPLVRVLMKHDASLNCKDNDGNTPLHIAVENNTLPLVRVLMKHGAQQLKNKIDRTLRDLLMHSSYEMLECIFDPSRADIRLSLSSLREVCSQPALTQEEQNSIKIIYQVFLEYATRYLGYQQTNTNKRRRISE